MSPTAFVPTIPLTRTTTLTLTTPTTHPTILRTPYPTPLPHTPVATPLATPPSPPARPKRILLWFHTTLRLHDNPALTTALRTADLPGACLVPVAQHTPAAAPLLQELKARLQAAGSDLLHLPSTTPDALLHICERLKLTAVYFNTAADAPALAVQQRVTRVLEGAGIHVEAFDGCLLPLDNTLKGVTSPTPRDVFRCVRGDAAEYVAAPERLPALPAAAAGVKQVPLVARIAGGTSAAIKLLARLDKGRETLVLSRSTDTAVLLKTHLDYGSVSPRMVAAAVKRVLGGLKGRTFSELVWRTYVGVVAQRALGARVKAVA